MSDLIHKFGATEFENVSLGAPSLESGIAFLHDKTGLTATPFPVPEGAANRSAILHTQARSVIEIIAPNPDFRGVDHLFSELGQLPVPQLIAWSVQTTDYDAMAERVVSLDHPIEAVQEQQVDLDGFKQSLKAARLGPGEDMVRPLVTAYMAPTSCPQVPDPKCLPTALHLTTWHGPPLSRLLDGLGLSLRAASGPPALRLTLDTPKGPVTLESGDWIKGGTGMAFKRLGRQIGGLFRRR